MKIINRRLSISLYKKQLLCFICIILAYNYLCAQQVSQKLIPAGNIKIIGTSVSVDYDNNNIESTTVNTIANVFDGNLNTFFASYIRTGGWAGLDLGEKHVITKIAYCPRQSQTGLLLLGVIEGANKPDFGDALPIYLITETPPKNILTEKAIDCSRGFRYVRYVGTNNARCTIAELEFWGYKSSGNDTKLYHTTNLPDVIIHTTNAVDIVSKDNYIKGIVSVISENGTKFYSDSLKIRGRGNTSWTFPKKPYKMKLYKKARLLENPANERDWTLINNYGDKTLMRNMLIFDLSRRLQVPYTPARAPVNVYLNGEYKGCYQLCDHVEVAEKRVNVQTMIANDVTLPNLSGGYLIEMDAYASKEKKWFSSQKGVPVRIKYPDEDEIVDVQFDYIKDHFNKMEAAIYSSNYKDPVNGYRKYLDTETFIRHFLIGEISGNTDTYWQTDLYKKRNDDKLYVGPAWDFDLAYDNDNRTYPINNNPDWIYASTGACANNVRNMVNKLLTDADLVEQLKAIYAYYRDTKIITEDALLAVVDYYAAELEESQKLNFIRWNIMKQIVHQNPKAWGSYNAEVENVRRYIRERIKWMDKKLSYSPAIIVDDPPNKTDEMYFKNITVSAFAGKIYIEGIETTTLVEIFNIAGNRVFSKTIHGDTTLSIPFPNGIYLIRLSNDEGCIKVIKLSLLTI